MTFDAYWEWLQIPPERRPPTHYELLGLPAGEADPKRIRDAADTRYEHVHKYIIGPQGEEAARLLTEIAAAVQCLTDPLKKEAYDREELGIVVPSPPPVEPAPTELQAEAEVADEPESAAAVSVEPVIPAAILAEPAATEARGFPVFGRILGFGVRIVRGVDRFLLMLAGGDENTILHNFLRSVAAVALVFAVGITGLTGASFMGSLFAVPREKKVSMHGLVPPEQYFQPTESRTIEVGRPLRVAVSLRYADPLGGKVRFMLGPDAPAGASIDSASGIFTWTPREDQGRATYHVTVLAEHPDGRKGRADLNITVTKPLRLQPIAPQTVDVGKLLDFSASIDLTKPWQRKLRFSLGANVPTGASIEAETGRFTWRPTENQRLGEYLVAVCVEDAEGQRDFRFFTITVTKPGPSAAMTTPSPLPQREIALDLGGGVMLELVLIPAGSFLMGAPDSEARSDEKPQHRVQITRAFYLGKYEVTQEQWQALMGSNPSDFKGPKNPVDHASWDDCQAFLTNLNEKYGSNGLKFSLPTEAQWEYACRAGSAAQWCSGDDESALRRYAWYADNSGVKTHPVGEKEPNSWGLYDMHGNSREWCADWYSDNYYSQSIAEDPIGPSSGSFRVLRGGAWHVGATFCRSAGRFSDTPSDANYGFRVACVR